MKLTPLVEEIVSVAEEQHEECDDLEHDINDMEVAVQLFPVPTVLHLYRIPTTLTCSLIVLLL